MNSNELDIKKNESNYGLNRLQRRIKKSACDIYFQDTFNSIKGLLVVDRENAYGSMRNSMLKKSTDIGTLEDEGIIGDWHPKGKLINTIFPVNRNDLSHPVTSIVVSEDSQSLISGTKNGMLHYFNLSYDGEEIKVDCNESMLITNFDKPRQIN